MCKKFLFLIVLIITWLDPVLVNAQRTCASHSHYLNQLKTDTVFAKRRLEIEAHTLANNTKPVRALKTIPVVVHVLYNTAAQNISDAQILSQIDVLNADFRKLNADFTNTPAVFQPLGADCEIEFCLAQQTPSGQATNGIVRVQTSTTSFTDNDQMKYSTSGGSNAWDATKYLNIWVCPLGSGLLGYAQFPGGPLASDGVVVRHQSFGTIGTVTAPYNKGRTATHEVGHWLNLFHIWGDDGSLCTGSDLVGDTPNQADENFSCPTFPAVSCNNGPNGDMFMNYMDYTNDNCMSLFTAGQSTRMNALFVANGSRASLLSSMGCLPPGTVLCGTPTGLAASNITNTSATLTWTAVANATSYSVQYKLASVSTWITTTTNTTTNVISNLVAGSNYQFQIQANCASGAGSFSSIGSFTTTANNPGCVNNYEPNNTRGTAVNITLGTNVISMLGSNTDRDYFKVTTTSSAPKLLVSLTNLPADYELKLYNAGGTLLKSSLRTGTSNEIIKYNASALGQTYTIYVYGYNGAFNATQCYTLNVQANAIGFREDDLYEDDKKLLTCAPNPTSGKLEVTFDALEAGSVVFSVYSMLGQRVYQENINTEAGEQTINLDLSNLSTGLYLLEVMQGDERTLKRINIVK